jgi:hypothetical protein
MKELGQAQTMRLRYVPLLPVVNVYTFTNAYAYGHHSLELLLIKVFDKKYYEALFTETWRPRNMGGDTQDWTTGNGDKRMMLNTDVSLLDLFPSDPDIILH